MSPIPTTAMDRNAMKVRYPVNVRNAWPEIMSRLMEKFHVPPPPKFLIVNDKATEVDSCKIMIVDDFTPLTTIRIEPA